MDVRARVGFVRARGLAVLATGGADAGPQAALVGVAVTDSGEVIFDTLRSSRKFANVERDERVALVVGWEDEVTVQCEGVADVLVGADLERCRPFFFQQYPDGREQAKDPDIVYVRVRPHWLRYSDFRPASFEIDERLV